MVGERRADGPASSVSGVAPSLLEEAAVLWQDVRGLIHDRLRLVALEARQAGESLAIIVAAAVIIALLLCSAWLGLIGAGVLLLINNGVGVILAVLLAVAMNLLGAVLAYRVVSKRKALLQFPATIRAFQPVSSNAEAPPP